MTESVMSYEQYAAASAYTQGLDNSVEDMFPSSFRSERHMTAKPARVFTSALDAMLPADSEIDILHSFGIEDLGYEQWPEVRSTLLVDSGMRDEARRMLAKATTFTGSYFAVPYKSRRVIELFEEIGTLAQLENEEEVLRFLSHNKDLLNLVRKTLQATQKHPDILSRKAWVFVDPENGSESLYIGAVIQGEDYDRAYEIENAVFEEALDQVSGLNQFRILLCFETEEDAQPA